MYCFSKYPHHHQVDLTNESGSMIKMRKDFTKDYFVTKDAINTVVSELTGICSASYLVVISHKAAICRATLYLIHRQFSVRIISFNVA